MQNMNQNIFPGNLCGKYNYINCIVVILLRQKAFADIPSRKRGWSLSKGRFGLNALLLNKLIGRL